KIENPVKENLKDPSSFSGRSELPPKKSQNLSDLFQLADIYFWLFRYSASNFLRPYLKKFKEISSEATKTISTLFTDAVKEIARFKFFFEEENKTIPEMITGFFYKTYKAIVSFFKKEGVRFEDIISKTP